MRVLVTGAGGMLGRAVAEHCRALGDEVLAFEHKALDISNLIEVNAAIKLHAPDAVVNCAAWTDVDGCELDPHRSEEANALGPENLAVACRAGGASLVTVSTDYVFDGRKEGFYTQRDDPNPQSVYAVTKLQGERRAQAACARTTVVRTGWVFGAGGKNFLSRVVELARKGNALKAITDSYGTPTYAADLAARLRFLAEMDLPGVYHVVNAGPGASFKEFALAALAAGGAEESARLVEDVSMDDLRRPAPRPRNSRLRCLVSEAVGLPPLPDWLDALNRFTAAQGAEATD